MKNGLDSDKINKGALQDFDVFLIRSGVFYIEVGFDEVVLAMWMNAQP